MADQMIAPVQGEHVFRFEFIYNEMTVDHYCVKAFVKVCRASSAIGDERGGALSRVEDEDLPQRHTGCALTNMILIHKIFKSFSKCA